MRAAVEHAIASGEPLGHEYPIVLHDGTRSGSTRTSRIQTDADGNAPRAARHLPGRHGTAGAPRTQIRCERGAVPRAPRVGPGRRRRRRPDGAIIRVNDADREPVRVRARRAHRTERRSAATARDPRTHTPVIAGVLRGRAGDASMGVGGDLYARAQGRDTRPRRHQPFAGRDRRRVPRLRARSAMPPNDGTSKRRCAMALDARAGRVRASPAARRRRRTRSSAPSRTSCARRSPRSSDSPSCSQDETSGVEPR